MNENNCPLTRPLSSERIDPIQPGPILLHVCCAPCSSAIIDALLEEKFSPSLFFYNPNIAPFQEYEYRKRSVIAYAKRLGIPFIDADYEHEKWLEKVLKLANAPEKGRRCSLCFDMRLERTALYAFENHFSLFATTNGISPKKDMDQVNQSGLQAAARYPGLVFWDRNWRLNGALEKASRINKQEKFYRQLYCGCPFSLKLANAGRAERGLGPIAHGTTFYGTER